MKLIVSLWFCFLLLLPVAIEGRAQKTSKPSNPSRRATGALKVITGRPFSYVFINSVLHGATKENGELNLARVWAGSFPVRVRTAGFADWTGTVVIAVNGSRTLKVTQQPSSDEALLHYQKAEELRYRGKSKDAIQEYQQAIALRPLFAEARISMTRSLIAAQDFQEAEKQIQAALKIGGRTQVEAQTVLANMRRNQGLIDEAIAEYKKALQLARGNSFEAHIGLAIALNESGDVDEAVKEYRLGIAQDMDTEPILYYQLAEILENAQRYKEAIEAYQSYVRLDPEGEFASAAESIIERLKEEIKNQ